MEDINRPGVTKQYFFEFQLPESGVWVILSAVPFGNLTSAWCRMSDHLNLAERNGEDRREAQERCRVTEDTVTVTTRVIDFEKELLGNLAQELREGRF